MRRTVLLVAGAILSAAPAWAQPEYPPVRDPYLTVTYGSASRSQDAHQHGGSSLYNETLAFDILHSLDRAAFVDIGAGVRAWRGLFLGGAFTVRKEPVSAPIVAFVPHPVFYDSFRTVEGTVPGLEFREYAFHIQATWRFAPAPSFQVGVFGGPTLFNVSHDLVEKIDIAESGGTFAQVNLGEATRRRDSEGLFGAHAGVDAMYRIVRHVGIGGMVRYSRAVTELAAPEGLPVGFTVGGLDAGVRVRIGF